MFAVNAAHWWGPLGWTYRNCPGNLAASLLWVPLGAFGTWLIAARKRLQRSDAHHQWMAQHMARIHLAVTDEVAAPHPQHGVMS